MNSAEKESSSMLEKKESMEQDLEHLRPVVTKDRLKDHPVG